MAEQAADNQLSERQIEILRLAAKGATNQQIAIQLDIAENTVKAHLRNIYSKIGVSSRTEASIYAERAGLLSSPPPQSDSVPEQKYIANDLDETDDLRDSHAPEAAADDTTTELVLSLPSPPQLHAPVGGRARGQVWLLGGGVLVGMLIIGLLFVVMQMAGMISWFEPGFVTSLASPAVTTEPLPAASPEKTDFLQTNTALDHTRIGFGLSSYDGKIYVIGGETGEGVSELVTRYNPQQDTWAQVASLPYALADIQSVEIGGKLYVAGGRTITGTISNGFLLYDPVQDQWQSLPPLPAPRSRYAAASLEGKYYLFGGWDGHTYGSQVWMFSPDTNKWESTPLSPMPEPRADMSAVLIGNRIHLIGGSNADGPVVSHHAYNPNLDILGNNPWRVLPRLPQAVEGPIAAVAIIDSIYTFDPASGELRIYDTGREEWNSSDIALPTNNLALQVIMVNTRLFMLGSTGDGAMYHFSYQAVYRTQLPIISR